MTRVGSQRHSQKKFISFGNNFVFIYISLSVGVWWRVGNTKLLKHKKTYYLLVT